MENVDGLAVSFQGCVARLVIDRPARRNAITLAMWRGLTAHIHALSARSDVRVIILSGAGSDFSAGADISEFDTERANAESARNYEAANTEAFAAVRNARIPVIASIRGICFGGGFGLAAAADLRIAAPDALFSIPAAKLGLAYPQEAMVDIVSSLGPQLARYLAFTGARVDAVQALAAGFLLEMVDPAALDQRVTEIANQVASSAPLSVRASKLSIATVIAPSESAIRAAREVGDITFESADYAEGRAAFKQKRPPKFEGQ